METSLVDLGLDRQSSFTETFIGKIRRFSTLEKCELIFLIGSTVALLAVLGLTIAKLATVSSTSNDFTFAFVLLINTVFCIFYVVHGILAERPYEIIILVTATVIILFYLGLNFGFSERGTLKLIRLVIAIIFGLFLFAQGVWYSWKYYVENHLIFRIVGANSDLQKMCKIMYFYYDVLKFDLQLAFSIVVFVLAFETNKIPTVEIVILAVGIVIAIMYFILGNLAVMNENKIMSVVFLVLSLVSPAYIIYRIEKSAEYIQLNGGASPITGSVLTCAIMAFICRVVLVVSFVIVFRNYGKGLKEKVYGVDDSNPQTNGSTQQTNPAGPTVNS